MQADRRRIQTAVLSSAESEEPLMLPMEAIELDVFRHRYEGETFWCGTLLGGCGGQLTTKLYTDRACHFAHHPDPDGLPHACGRRARGVNSADHLYVRSAAAAWLASHGEQASFEYTGPAGAPLGSVVDIRWPRGALRVHLDQTVAPVWDDGLEPVLGLGVPVDRDTLIRRWYVHRIRLDSEGTSRRVRIGTEAFARPTEWFALEECEVTERGLSTPAVQRIIQARSAAAPTKWTPGQNTDTAQDTRARELLRKLLYARRTESIALAESVCREIPELAGVSPRLQEQLDAALRSGLLWIEKEVEARRELFASLEQAVAEKRAGKVKKLLRHAKTAAKEACSEEESRVINAADACLTAIAAARSQRLNTLLDDLDQLPPDPDPDVLRIKVRELLRAASEAGSIGPHRQAKVQAWRERVRHTAGPLQPGQEKRLPQLHRQVTRKRWLERCCPRCGANSGQQCAVDTMPGEMRQVPHDERLKPIIDERKEQQRLRRPWRVYEVTCPDCGQEPEQRCTTLGGPHRSRVELAKEYTRLKKAHS
ncbi:zinc finger domain-containing protein [Streptomyces sp. 1222.5]|uniref:zinc finger domain-containing protein n=1 Tax=Streptomyces sp. 1222.5 TaxID=1881026 RepID=UPI003D751521